MHTDTDGSDSRTSRVDWWSWRFRERGLPMPVADWCAEMACGIERDEPASLSREMLVLLSVADHQLLHAGLTAWLAVMADDASQAEIDEVAAARRSLDGQQSEAVSDGALTLTGAEAADVRSLADRRLPVVVSEALSDAAAERWRVRTVCCC